VTHRDASISLRCAIDATLSLKKPSGDADI